MRILSDIDAERAVLSGLFKYGSYSYHSISDLNLTDNVFTIESHRIIFKCLEKIFKEHNNIKPDIALLYSSSSDLGLKHWFLRDDEVQYVASLTNFPIKEENIRVFAKKIKKLEIGRLISEKLQNAQQEILGITGTESINDIFTIIENNIIDCTKFINTDENQVKLLGQGIREHFEFLEKNPITQVGISTGMPIYDSIIGGGLRSGGINIIMSRPKQGKSTLALNIGSHISNLDIPVLYLDTEMHENDAWDRMVARISGIPIKDVESGQYSKFTNNKTKVNKAIEEIENLKIYRGKIAGLGLENQIALIKRWLITEVGIQQNGQANKCCVIYDYIKIMDEGSIKNLQEYQAVGFLINSIMNFSIKYNFPVLGFVQSNRTGISKEDSSIIALSDRILWFCHSMSIFKSKSREEIELSGFENGNKKLKVLDCRYGPGMNDADYINCYFNTSIAKITEGKTAFEILKEKKKIVSSKENTEKKSQNKNSDNKIQF